MIKEFEEIETYFAEQIDNWYFKAKEELRNKGDHSLGMKKEILKSTLHESLNALEIYCKKVKGRK